MEKYAALAHGIREHVRLSLEKRAQMTHAVPAAQRKAQAVYNAVSRSAMGRLHQTAQRAGVAPAALTRINPAAQMAPALKGIWGPGNPRQQQLLNFQMQLTRLPTQQRQILQQNPSFIQNLWQSFQNMGQLPVGG